MAGRFSLFARPGPPLDASPPPAPDDELLSTGAAPVEPSSETALPPPPPRPIPPQRERRALMRQREIEMRDVGGLAVEMARRDDWRYELLRSRCAEVLALEERIHELDALIAAGEMAARGVGVAPCTCGAPILRGSHFCSHCGRPAPETPPVASCSHCGQPLPAEANFCAYCGNSAAADEFASEHDLSDTIVRSWPAADERAGDG